MDKRRRHLREGELAGIRYRLALDLPFARGRSGDVLSRAAGSSREFHDHREYLPGDDLRHIDWSAYGRSDKLIVKLFREEVSPHMDLVVDASRSMALAGSQKARAARSLAALMAQAAANAGYSYRVWAAGRLCRDVCRLNEPTAAWEPIEFDSVEALNETLRKGAPPWRPLGVRVLVSDLLWPGDPADSLRLLGRGASQSAVVQVLARADAEPEAYGNVRLVDSESGLDREVFVDASALGGYRRALSRHQDAWRAACREVGAAMVTLVAEDVVRDWRMDEMVAARILEAA